jgi:phosphoenolpyruvate synthase/pyruvate phosphate dikinase
VVAGIRTPRPIAELEKVLPKAYAQLREITTRLERHYKDVQDFEFTIEENTLYMLQTRNGKRTGLAAVHIAVDMVEEGILTQREAVAKVEPTSLDQLLHPIFDPRARLRAAVAAKGLPASPGAATGGIVFTADDAVAASRNGKRVVLVRMETVPDDIHGMSVAQGILTATGGMTCVAGEAMLVTDRGVLTAEDAFGAVAHGAEFRILSFDTAEMEPVWRKVVAAGSRQASVVSVAVSQTGSSDGNRLRLTADHKLLTINKRRLAKKRLDAVLSDGDFVTVVGKIPPLCEVTTSPALAYVAGALFSDGHIRADRRHGVVQFIQKNVPAKTAFISAVERAFDHSFGVGFTSVRTRETVGTLRGREIRGSVEDRFCYRRDPAQELLAIRDNVTDWVLTLDRNAVLSFLAGYVDGDGSYAEESSPVRLQIVVARTNRKLLQALALACLRLGIVPQVTNNREAYLLQIAEKVDEILQFTQRVKAEIRPRQTESRCLSVRDLFADVVDTVNYMGRVREGIKRNIMFGAEAIRRDLLPIMPTEGRDDLQALLDSPLRSYRVKPVAEAEAAIVYNFEVDATDELDKNFVVLTEGMTPVLVSNSHAAVVGRQMGKPSVVGCGALDINAKAKTMKVGGKTLQEGDSISIDGSTGEVILEELPTSPSEVLQVVAGTLKAAKSPLYGKFEKLLGWADEVRKLGVRANADIPRDAKIAFAFGARGIGLCRTEHMFFAADRLALVVKMILSAARGQRGLDLTRRLKEKLAEARGSQATEVRKEIARVGKQYGKFIADYTGAIAKLLPMQRADFAGLFREMHGHPVTIRTLDPPLHEFLPKREELMVRIATLQAKGASANRAKIASLSRMLRAVEELHEFNPMLGHRGCRLGITYPEITRMQARAIFEAAVQVARKGTPVKPEVMIPLVGHVEELRRQADIVRRVATEVLAKAPGVEVDFLVGTMIEVPRGAITADAIAKEAEFFSFGTNDLTQMGFGLSRDDAGKFLGQYIEEGILDKDPFVSIDVAGVGQLVEIGVRKGREAKPGLKIGVCGEHGGDPASIRFFHAAGLDYVSCSPYRVPIARLAAAQAELEKPVGD